MNNIAIHQSIADLYQPIRPKTPRFTGDFTIHSLKDLHPVTPFRSPLYRAEYFSFVFIKSGKGTYTTNHQQFSFQENTIYFTNPGHTKSFYIDELEEGYLMTLTESFLRENVHQEIFDEFPFLLAEVVSPRQFNDAEFAEMEAIYLQILHHSKQDSPYKKRILGNLFVVLLLKIKEKCWQCYCPIEEGDRTSQIVKSFKRILAQQFKNVMQNPKDHTLQVQDIAQQLNLHPSYLSNVIKSKTGKSVNHWITKKLMNTAKHLLKSTTYSSKEISYALGFSEPTHFSRFFKKQTGMTPTAYKKSVLPAVYS
jgi:YesN/AraC family two-component response regulator